MKTTKVATVVTMLVIGTTLGVAQHPPSNTKSRIAVLKREISSKRPQSPPYAFIECSYYKGCMSFNFSGGVDNVYAQLTDSNDMLLWDGYISNAYNTVGIPELSGEYNIVCIDEYGNEFIGTLEFD